jgi:hypothetical protein
MSDIQSLIKMLQSNNPDKRYDACEELRVSSCLPEEAFEALRSATSDSNPDVADAAQRALALHAEIKKEPNSNYQNQTKNASPLIIWQVIGTGIITGIVIAALVFAFFFNPTYFDSKFPFLSSYESWYLSKIFGQFLVFTVWELIFSITGALIGNSSKKTRRAIWIGSIIGSLFPIFVAIAFLLLILLSGWQ